MTQETQYQDMYSDVAERFEEAYSAFRRTYETMNPPPEKPEIVEGHSFGWKQVGMLCGLLGSLVVSGSHSIPVFVGMDNVTPLTIFIGISAFLMVELGIIVFAYSTTEQQHKTGESIRNRVKKYTRNGLYFIVTVAVLANVVNVLEHNVAIPDDVIIQTAWSSVRIVIFLAVGISAPVMAFLTGEILAVDVLEHRSHYSKILAAYEVKLAEWQDGLNRSWASQKKKWGATIDIDNRVQRLSSVGDATDRDNLSVYNGQTDRQTLDTYNRVGDATDRAIQYLESNPDDMGMTLRELANIIGVGKDSVSKAKKHLNQ